VSKNRGGNRLSIWAVSIGLCIVIGSIATMALLGLDVAGIAGVLTAAAVIIGTIYRLFASPPRHPDPRHPEPVDPDDDEEDEKKEEEEERRAA